MQLSDKPSQLTIPFANSGTRTAIPTPSQIGITAGAASLTDGFPPLTRTPIAAGGVPPSGADMNGILYQMSAADRWANVGGGYPYDSTYATAIGGYPKGARVVRTDGIGYWLNTADNNTTDPEAGGAGWVPDLMPGATAVTMTGSNVTLTALQYGQPVIRITGLLTGDLNLIFPAIAGGEWTVINATTGAFTITAKTASGTGVTVTGASCIVGDGTNILSVSPVVAAVTAASDPTFVDSSVSPASTNWVRGAMLAIATAAGFAISASTNGYVKFPSWLGGLIIQWGSAARTVAGDITVTFPLAFPTAFYSAVSVPFYASPISNTWKISSATTTSMVLNSQNAGAGYYENWIAVGK